MIRVAICIIIIVRNNAPKNSASGRENAQTVRTCNACVRYYAPGVYNIIISLRRNNNYRSREERKTREFARKNRRNNILCPPGHKRALNACACGVYLGAAGRQGMLECFRIPGPCNYFTRAQTPMGKIVLHIFLPHFLSSGFARLLHVIIICSFSIKMISAHVRAIRHWQ